jgi:hypothetical protein
MKLLRLASKSAERFEAIIAFELGAYKAKLKKNGKPHYGICVDPATGNEFNITISNGELIKISDFSFEEPIYYDLYPLLSGFVHPDITRDVLKSVRTKTVESSNAGDPIIAIILGSKLINSFEPTIRS